jgi:hypothetical protein
VIKSFINRLFGLSSDDHAYRKLQSEFANLTEDMDFDDPEVRIGTQIFLILSEQFEIIGNRQGKFPPVAPFAADSAKGALIGTAVAVVLHEIDSPPNKIMIDAIVTAFTLAFGDEYGPDLALEAMNQSAADNTSINSASDWAIIDTKASLRPGAISTASAYIAAVKGLI